MNDQNNLNTEIRLKRPLNAKEIELLPNWMKSENKEYWIERIGKNE